MSQSVSSIPNNCSRSDGNGRAYFTVYISTAGRKETVPSPAGQLGDARCRSSFCIDGTCPSAAARCIGIYPREDITRQRTAQLSSQHLPSTKGMTAYPSVGGHRAHIGIVTQKPVDALFRTSTRQMAHLLHKSHISPVEPPERDHRSTADIQCSDEYASTARVTRERAVAREIRCSNPGGTT